MFHNEIKNLSFIIEHTGPRLLGDSFYIFLHFIQQGNLGVKFIRKLV